VERRTSPVLHLSGSGAGARDYVTRNRWLVRERNHTPASPFGYLIWTLPIHDSPSLAASVYAALTIHNAAAGHRLPRFMEVSAKGGFSEES